MNCQVCTDYAKETDHVPKKSQKPRPKKEVAKKPRMYITSILCNSIS